MWPFTYNSLTPSRSTLFSTPPFCHLILRRISQVVKHNPPPPVLLENGPEWEVEELVDVRKGNWKGAWGWEWLVRWKGFGVGDDSWETQEELLRAPEALQEFYQRYPEKLGPPHLKGSPTPISKQRRAASGHRVQKG